MELDLADVKPSVLSWVTTGLLAVTFIVFMKYVTARYNVAFLKDFFGAV